MKSIAKYLSVAATAVLCGTAFADGPARMVINFTTEPVAYADGSTLQKGEWCALCWSPNENFGGMDANCNPLVAGDKVLRVRPYANADGSFGPILFVVDASEVASGGNYFVYALDTRKAEGGIASANASGKPEVVNGSVLATLSELSAAEGAYASSVGNAVDNAAYDPVFAPGSVVKAAISKFELVGDNAVITVSGMSPSVRYNVQFGKTLDTISSVKVEKRRTGKLAGGDVVFEIPKDEANFFKVVRE